MTNTKTIKFRYIFSDNYNPTFASGAYGGVTPDGRLVVNFYLERQGLPHSQTYELSDAGVLGKEVSEEPEDYRHTLVRFVDMGIVLDLKSAKVINEWLGKQIEELERRERGGAGESE